MAAVIADYGRDIKKDRSSLFTRTANGLKNGIFNTNQVNPSQIPSSASSKRVTKFCQQDHVQSPINFESRICVLCDNCDPLRVDGHWEDLGTATVQNTGKTAVVTLGNRKPPTINGGPLDVEYVLHSLHFHWAANDETGCEHTINGQKYSMEGHLVHYNSRYDTINEAIDKPDGLAVLGFFFQAFGTQDCEEFKKISDGVNKVNNLNTTTNIPADCLTWMSMQELEKHYFSYKGSLTTAPFAESVTWIVYRTPIFISEQQMVAFRNLQASPELNMPKILNNYRPTQKVPDNHQVAFARSVYRGTRD